MRRWHAPGYEAGEDRALLIYPAAGWVQHAHRTAYAAPGYLVLNPADRASGLRDRAVYYIHMPDGQLIRAWAKGIQTMTVDHRGVSLQTLEGLQQAGQRFDVLRYIDEAGPSVSGYTVSEYQVDMAKAVEEGRLASPELHQLVAHLEAWRGL